MKKLYFITSILNVSLIIASNERTSLLAASNIQCNENPVQQEWRYTIPSKKSSLQENRYTIPNKPSLPKAFPNYTEPVTFHGVSVVQPVRQESICYRCCSATSKYCADEPDVYPQYCVINGMHKQCGRTVKIMAPIGACVLCAHGVVCCVHAMPCC